MIEWKGHVGGCCGVQDARIRKKLSRQELTSLVLPLRDVPGEQKFTWVLRTQESFVQPEQARQLLAAGWEVKNRFYDPSTKGYQVVLVRVQ